MARVTGVFTGWKGKVGNVVFQMWKGVQVAKTKVTPENPQSTGQTTNRTLWSTLVAMFKPILKTFVWIYWNPFEGDRNSGWAKLIGVNQKLQAGLTIDYEDVLVSQGALPGEEIVTLTYNTADGATSCTWAETCGSGGAGTDFACLCIYNKDNGKWCISDGSEERGDELIELTLPAGYDITDCYGYLFFFTTDPVSSIVDAISDSVAQETIAPA